MTSQLTNDRESTDAAKVDTALEAIIEGRLDEAEALLLAVIANTPSEYANSEENDQGIAIKFWSQTDFIHYVMWRKDRGLADTNISWIGNAYPRAHYYLGFLCVKRKQFERAITFLDSGQSLEPTNPKFAFEKAQALVNSRRFKEALALYDRVTELTAHVTVRDLAIARRGRGFVLIEMNDLNNAEIAFKSSLEFEPENEIAMNELRYIQHLRKGGATTLTETAPTTDSLNPSKCAACAKQFDKGVLVSLNGRPVSICKRCKGKLTKKWWQFWK
ncbi:MAG: tetratricopeptide repeat protein [Planctomycetia bacterium]|nr:tetratricopeptide repeat protein [Planctomycetia bacterium]